MCLQLKEIAPEYYETLAYHTSWTWVTWKFLSDPEVGPWTRMRRPTREAAPAPATPDKAAALVRLPPQTVSSAVLLCAHTWSGVVERAEPVGGEDIRHAEGLH